MTEPFREGAVGMLPVWTAGGLVSALIITVGLGATAHLIRRGNIAWRRSAERFLLFLR